MGSLRRVWRLLLITGICGSWSVFPSSSAGADTAKDAQVVYCLGSVRQTELVEAGIALDQVAPGRSPGHVIVSGKEMDLRAWRRTDPTSFDRVCKALYLISKDSAGAAAKGGGSGLSTLLTILLPVVIGAVLTLLAGDWRSTRDIGRIRADALREAAHEFTVAVSDYVRDWIGHSLGSPPSDRDVQRARARLDTQLHRHEVVRRKWLFLRELRGVLASGPLGEVLTAGWLGIGDDEREVRSQRVDSALGDLLEGCEMVARALERPGRRNAEMRG